MARVVSPPAKVAATGAFFDLDRTLIDVNSGVLWARHELRLRNISPWQFTQALLSAALYHLSLVDMEQAFSDATRHYQGVEEAELDRRTRAWFSDQVAPRVRPKALEAVAFHRQEGHRLVILTNSSCFEAAAAAELWGFHGWLANVFPVDEQGRLLGTFETPLCYAKGKVHHAQRWALWHGVELASSFFYTDSFSDLPMLEEVGKPRVVAPDPRLRHAAKQRGWPILEW